MPDRVQAEAAHLGTVTEPPQPRCAHQVWLTGARIGEHPGAGDAPDLLRHPGQQLIRNRHPIVLQTAARALPRPEGDLATPHVNVRHPEAEQFVAAGGDRPGECGGQGEEGTWIEWGDKKACGIIRRQCGQMWTKTARGWSL